MPHLETKIQEEECFAKGLLVFRMKPLVPVHDRKMFIKSFTVKSRQDLWRVCHKAPRSNFPRSCSPTNITGQPFDPFLVNSFSSVMEFPDIEFEIGADAKRKIDSLYNHIAGAVYNLSMHVSSLGSQISEDHKDKISEVFPGSLCPLPPAPDSPAACPILFSRAQTQ